jgi:hypothetical protein
MHPVQRIAKMAVVYLYLGAAVIGTGLGTIETLRPLLFR